MVIKWIEMMRLVRKVDLVSHLASSSCWVSEKALQLTGKIQNEKKYRNFSVFTLECFQNNQQYLAARTGFRWITSWDWLIEKNWIEMVWVFVSITKIASEKSGYSLMACVRNPSSMQLIRYANNRAIFPDLLLHILMCRYTIQIILISSLV